LPDNYITASFLLQVFFYIIWLFRDFFINRSVRGVFAVQSGRNRRQHGNSPKHSVFLFFADMSIFFAILITLKSPGKKPRLFFIRQIKQPDQSLM